MAQDYCSRQQIDQFKKDILFAYNNTRTEEKENRTFFTYQHEIKVAKRNLLTGDEFNQYETSRQQNVEKYCMPFAMLRVMGAKKDKLKSNKEILAQAIKERSEFAGINDIVDKKGSFIKSKKKEDRNVLFKYNLITLDIQYPGFLDLYSNILSQINEKNYTKTEKLANKFFEENNKNKYNKNDEEKILYYLATQFIDKEISNNIEKKDPYAQGKLAALNMLKSKMSNFSQMLFPNKCSDSTAGEGLYMTEMPAQALNHFTNQHIAFKCEIDDQTKIIDIYNNKKLKQALIDKNIIRNDDEVTKDLNITSKNYWTNPPCVEMAMNELKVVIKFTNSYIVNKGAMNFSARNNDGTKSTSCKQMELTDIPCENIELFVKDLNVNNSNYFNLKHKANSSNPRPLFIKIAQRIKECSENTPNPNDCLKNLENLGRVLSKNFKLPTEKAYTSVDETDFCRKPFVKKVVIGINRILNRNTSLCN